MSEEIKVGDKLKCVDHIIALSPDMEKQDVLPIGKVVTVSAVRKTPVGTHVKLKYVKVRTWFPISLFKKIIDSTEDSTNLLDSISEEL